MTKKAKFLRRLNEAFSKNNTAYVVKQMTDDIRWTIIGDRTVVGKEAFIAALSEMAADKPLKLTIKNIRVRIFTGEVVEQIGVAASQNRINRVLFVIGIEITNDEEVVVTAACWI